MGEEQRDDRLAATEEMQRLRLANHQGDDLRVARVRRQVLGVDAGLLDAGDRLRVGVDRGGLLGAADEVLHRLVVHVGARVVMREELRLRAHDLRVAVLQELGDLAVVVLPRPPQQRLVRGVLDQRVLEDVLRARAPPALVEQLRVDELVQAALQGPLLERRDRLQHLVGELAPEDRAELRDFANARQAIEPRHQQVLQRGGDRDVRERTRQLVALLAIAHEIRLDDRLRQLLHVQRHAVGLVDHVFDHLDGHRLAAGALHDQRLHLRALEPAERDRRHVRAHRPAWHEVRTVRHDVHHRHRGRLLDAELEQRERRGIGPLQVLPDPKHGLLLRLLQQPRHQRVERALALLFGAPFERRVAALGKRQRHQRRVQGHRPVGGQEALPRERGFELREPRAGVVPRGPPHHALQMLDHRMKRRVGVIRRASRRDPDVLLARRPRAQRHDETRLPDARLALDQHDLPMPVPASVPRAQEKPELLLAPDQLQRIAAAVEPRAGEVALAHDPPGAQRLRQPLQRVRAEVLAGERFADQLARERTDDDRVRLCQCLQPRGHVRGLADDARALRRSFADDVADDHRTGGDADAHGKRRLQDVVHRTERGNRLDDRQCAPHGAFRVVLVRLRIAEIHEDAVAEVLGDVAVVARDDLRARVEIIADDVAQVLRIDARGERGRVDEIAEHHGELTPLAIAAPRRRVRVDAGGSVDRRGVAAESGNRLQQLLAWSERNVETLQILLRQLAQDVEIDLVLEEARRVLFEAERLEPLIDIASQGAPSGGRRSRQAAAPMLPISSRANRPAW